MCGKLRVKSEQIDHSTDEGVPGSPVQAPEAQQLLKFPNVMGPCKKLNIVETYKTFLSTISPPVIRYHHKEILH